MSIKIICFLSFRFMHHLRNHFSKVILLLPAVLYTKEKVNPTAGVAYVTR